MDLIRLGQRIGVLPREPFSQDVSDVTPLTDNPAAMARLIAEIKGTPHESASCPVCRDLRNGMGPTVLQRAVA